MSLKAHQRPVRPSSRGALSNYVGGLLWSTRAGHLAAGSVRSMIGDMASTRRMSAGIAGICGERRWWRRSARKPMQRAEAPEMHAGRTWSVLQKCRVAMGGRIGNVSDIKVVGERARVFVTLLSQIRVRLCHPRQVPANRHYQAAASDWLAGHEYISDQQSLPTYQTTF